jgi:ribosomal protein L2
MKTNLHPGKAEWIAVVNEMVDHARLRNSARAKAWFKSPTWLEVRTVLFTPERAAYIESLALETDHTHVILAPEVRERKSQAQRARWERHRQAKAAPVKPLSTNPKSVRSRQQYAKQTLEQKQRRNERNRATRQLKAERLAAQIQHIPTGVTHGHQTYSYQPNLQQ